MQTFLPKKLPINSYNTRSKSLDLLQNIAAQLPKLLLTNQVQSKINKLKKNDLSVDILIKNKKAKEINLAMVRSEERRVGKECER